MINQWALKMIRQYHGLLLQLGKDIFETEEMLTDKVGQKMPFLWQFNVASILDDFKKQGKDIVQHIAELRKEFDCLDF